MGMPMNEDGKWVRLANEIVTPEQKEEIKGLKGFGVVIPFKGAVRPGVVEGLANKRTVNKKEAILSIQVDMEGKSLGSNPLNYKAYIPLKDLQSRK